MKYFRVVAPDLAIDLGTANTLVYRKGKGILYREPTVVALETATGRILAIGEEAKQMIGKTPESIVPISPLAHGAVSDFDITLALLEHYIKKALPGVSILQPRLTISIPSGSTDVESRAIEDACLQAGARDVYLVEEALASAFGAGLSVDEPTGSMVMNLGAGTTEVAVCSLYGVVTTTTLKSGGDDMNLRIQDVLREKYSIMVGIPTCEILKEKIGTIRENSDCMEVSGRDVQTGMPRSVDVYSMDLREAIMPMVDEFVDSIRITLEKTPPELSADIMQQGLMLTGGGALLDGLAEYIADNIQMTVTISSQPMEDTIYGAAKIMDNIDGIKQKRVRR